MNPRLSICIATRNRAQFLGATLENLTASSEPGVEIVILDGASTDETAEVVKRFPSVRYQRQEVNGGVDRDYAAAVALASGEYCWLMSDDDFVKPHAMKRVLDELATNPGLVVVNAELRTPDMSEVLDPSRLPFTDDRTYTPADHERLFVDTCGFLTFIGGVVIRRRAFD
jgi:glycosyltransferase involved in cell wall biosynthesis